MLLKYQQLFEKLKEPQLGELVVCIGDIDELKTHNHVGILRKNGIEFIRRWTDKLHDLGGELKNNNGWYIKDPRWTKPFDDNNDGYNLPMLYSEDFKDVISYSLRFLLDYEKIFYSDISYIDITHRSDTISCLSAKDFQRLHTNEDPWTSTMRQNFRLGRFFKKIVDDPDKLIEDYVNEYKFSFNLTKNDIGRFKIAKGIDMARWYLEINYAPGGGSLHKSCMKHVKSQRRLPIYTNNPDKIKMLYLLNPMGKLLGRALLWKLDDPKDQIFMDRIYYAEDYVEKLFLDYARRKGILTKEQSEKMDMTLKVKLNRDYGTPKANPFMDTFKFFVRNGNYLTNKFNNFKVGEYWEYIDHD